MANVNFLYHDIIHAVQNTIACINSATNYAVMCWNTGLTNSVK